MDDNTPVNHIVNNNFDELLTATDEISNTNEKEDEVTEVNNETNNTNEDKSNIPLYQ